MADQVVIEVAEKNRTSKEEPVSANQDQINPVDAMLERNGTEMALLRASPEMPDKMGVSSIIHVEPIVVDATESFGVTEGYLSMFSCSESYACNPCTTRRAVSAVVERYKL